MIDPGVGIAAVVDIGSKFVERSRFTARHEASCDKEADKTLRLAERFDRVPCEDVDQFELQEYNMLHSRSMENLREYREAQEEYKRKEWLKEPLDKIRTRRKVRQVKRNLQSSSAREGRHLHDLETYSRANSSCGSSIRSRANSDSGLGLERFSRPYRSDSCSIRATGGSPPNASLDDIRSDEQETEVMGSVSTWLPMWEVMDIDPDETNPESGTVGSVHISSVPEPRAFCATGDLRCSSCETASSPEWRKGPSGKKDLCNMCGLRYARSRVRKSIAVQSHRLARLGK